MNDHDLFAELVAGYALDALEPGDERTLLDHLPACKTCREQLADMRDVAAGLAGEVPIEEPGVDLEARIRAAVAYTPQKTSADRRADSRIARPHLVKTSAVEDPPVGASRRPSLVPHPLYTLTRPSLVTLAAAVLAVLAIAGIGTYAIHVASQRDDKATALRAEQSVMAHLWNPNAYSVALTSRDPGNRRVSAAAIVDGRDVYLLADGLAKNNVSSSIYVLWAAHTTGPMVAVGTFDITTSNTRVTHLTLPSQMAAPSSFGITHESGRTVPSVPGPVVVIGTALSTS